MSHPATTTGGGAGRRDRGRSGRRAPRAAAAQAESRWSLAFQSASIILREGFEVVLIIGALLAYAVKSGNAAHAPRRSSGHGGRHRRQPAHRLGAGAVSFDATGAAGEVLEGATMLLAAAVLFFVSYWLISKAEADSWQRYIQGKVKSAVATGNAWPWPAPPFSPSTAKASRRRCSTRR